MYKEEYGKQDIYNVKKKTRRVPYTNAYPFFHTVSFVDFFFNTLNQASRYFIGVADASLEAVRTFNTHLIYNNLKNIGYSTEYIRDIFEVNANYHEQMSALAEHHQVENYRRQAEYHQYLADKYREATTENVEHPSNVDPNEGRPHQDIDYDLLAKKVAEELRKNQQA